MMFGVVLYGGTAFALLVFGDIVTGMLPTRVVTFVSPLAVLGMVGGSLLRRRLVDGIDRGVDPAERMARYMTATILSLAVIEGCGLVLITSSLIAGAPAAALVGGVFTAGIMALMGPDRREAGLGR
jgi:hypothetical protein